MLNTQKQVKPKTCRSCKTKFTPARPMQVACGPACALRLSIIKREKAAAEKMKAERKELKARREKLKKRSDWMREAQAAFNQFIRERDSGKPCICCGQLINDEGWKPGGSWDAGHFLSVGSHPELRFVETNCHRQLKSCNAGSSKYARKGRTVSEGYRLGLIARVGLAEVERLEGPHEPKKYSIEDLKAIRDLYRAKLKELKEGRR